MRPGKLYQTFVTINVVGSKERIPAGSLTIFRSIPANSIIIFVNSEIKQGFPYGKYFTLLYKGNIVYINLYERDLENWVMQLT